MNTRKKYIILAIVIVVGTGLFLWVRSYVFEKLGVSLHERIQSLDLSGFNVRYDSISVDWLSNVIEIDHLVLDKDPYDTTCIYPEYISVAKVRAEGVGLFSLIFRKVLSLESLHLDSARMSLRQNSSLFALDSTTRRKNEFSIKVDRVHLESANLQYTDSIACDVLTGFKSTISVDGLAMDFHPEKPFSYEALSLVLDDTEVTIPQDYYTFKIKKARMDFATKDLSADSVEVIPELGKLAFSRKFGFEIDRLEAIIPSFRAHGLSVALSDSALVKVSLAEIQFFLKVFRDKRLPFLTKKKLLPIAQLRELPFDLVIDSLKVVGSYVQYEEFGEDAAEAGNIFFDDLNAVLSNISNVSDTGNTKLAARAALFGDGNLDLWVTFPFETGKRSMLKGAVTNFNIPALNSILTPATQIKIESGTMKELLFNFSFDEENSGGEIELNYENLKLITFRQNEKSGEQSKDNLKTFIMNAFVFRKNMTDDLPPEKRKGTVAYQRDDSRSIFNFWSKSLVSGIKSAYNLDKMQAKQSERDSRKEEKLTRKEARKLKRAAKKKERG